MVLFSVKNISVYTEDKKIIDNISFNVEEKAIFAIIGPNGSGKSSLCYGIMGHKKYRIEGTISFEQKDITNSPTHEKAKNIFFIQQTPRELDGISLLTLLRSASGKESPEEKIEFNKHLMELAKQKGIMRFLKREVNKNLSGGEKKLTELFQLLVLQPKMAIVDEIDSGLDIEKTKVVAKELKEYVEKGGTLIIISHSPKFLEYLKPNKVMLLQNGRVKRIEGYELIKEIEERGYKEIQ